MKKIQRVSFFFFFFFFFDIIYLSLLSQRDSLRLSIKKDRTRGGYETGEGYIGWEKRKGEEKLFGDRVRKRKRPRNTEKDSRVQVQFRKN